MNKGFKYFFLSCALLLIIGHSILPHNHVDESFVSYEIKASNTISIVEILKLALSNNLGANHFEEFKDGKKLEFEKSQLSLGFAISIETTEQQLQTKRQETTFHVNTHSFECTFYDNPLRAPPALL